MDDVGTFCRAMHPRLVGALALHCGDRHVAEELAQETLARVWERWPSVREMASPESWTYRVGFNLAASRFRRRSAERRARARAGEGLDAHVPDLASALAVRAAVAALPPRQRAAVVLRYFADLSVDDTAAALRCAPGTVKALTSQAITALRATFEVEVTNA
jgi:RNA polymerase sigma factor (sigma-70 family)